MILVLGGIFDSVDGRIARLTGTQSHFGEEFDSISDVVSFGVAPAFLVYNRFFVDYGRIGMVISFLFLLCGALRLARFNANIDKVNSYFFQGLPIPSGALGIVGLVLWSLEFPMIKDYGYFALVYVLFYAILMVSNIPFYSFKDSSWVRNHKKQVLATIFFLLLLLFTYVEIMIGILITIYVVGALLYFLLHKGDLADVFEWKDEKGHDY